MARVAKCPKCGKQGTLQLKNGKYWRVGHYVGFRGKNRIVRWCYIGKELPGSLRTVITQEQSSLPTDLGKRIEADPISFFKQSSAEGGT